MTRHLRQTILHFDLNRTILMSDTSGSRSIEDTVNYLLSECIWGYVDPTSTTPRWVCTSTTPSVVPPSPNSMTYKQFVASQLPYQTSIQEEQSKDLLRMTSTYDFNMNVKKQRTLLESAFTNPLGPGNILRDVFDDLMERLHFPAGTQRDKAQRLAMEFPDGPLKEAWKQGRYYLLPSFILFLFQLECDSNIKIVFRTFGEDLPHVAKELDLLTVGEHPLCYVGDCHHVLSDCFRLHIPNPNDEVQSSQQIGTFFRRGSASNETALTFGTIQTVQYNAQTMDPARSLDAVLLEQHRSSNRDTVYGFRRIYERLCHLFTSSAQCTFAFRDYWDIWHAHGERFEFGKLLLLQEDCADNICFFDDHIETESAHIIDVRDVNSGTCVPFSVCKEKHYLSRVEPYWAITDNNYFINHVLNRSLKDAS